MQNETSGHDTGFKRWFGTSLYLLSLNYLFVLDIEIETVNR